MTPSTRSAEPASARGILRGMDRSPHRMCPLRHVALIAALSLTALGCDEVAQAAPSTEMAPAPPVHVAAVEARSWVDEVEVTAELEAQHQVTIRAEAPGRLASLLVDVGDRVRAGQRLGRYADGQQRMSMDVARAELAAAETQRTRATRQLAQARRLAADGAIAANRVEDAEDSFRTADASHSAAGARVRLGRQTVLDVDFRAPFDGVVAARFAEPGEWVSPGFPILLIVARDALRAELPLAPADALRVEEGGRVQATFSARPGDRFSARVERMGEIVDPRSGRLSVFVTIDEDTERVRPGLVGRFRVPLGAGRTALSIPTRAVVRRAHASYVFVVDRNDRAEARNVTLGTRREGRVEVLSGLAAEERVVVDGLARVAAGEPVTVVPPPAPRAPAEAS